MRRSGRLRAKRLKPGVTGRAALDRSAYRALLRDLARRAAARCEVPWCRTVWRLDPHHIVKRSQGGADALENLTLICRTHHDQTDAAYTDGRLVVTMTAAGPQFQVVTRPRHLGVIDAVPEADVRA